MITGDSYPTACGVAKKVGLLSKRSKIIVLSSIQESACLEK
jgi:magnesium-transporting ATPase (P-type)